MKSFHNALQYIRAHIFIAAAAFIVCCGLIATFFVKPGSIRLTQQISDPPSSTLKLSESGKHYRVMVDLVKNSQTSGGLKAGDEIQEVCVPIFTREQFHELVFNAKPGSYIRVGSDAGLVGSVRGIFPLNVLEKDGGVIFASYGPMQTTSGQMVDVNGMKASAFCSSITSLDDFGIARSQFMAWHFGQESILSNFAPIEVHALRGDSMVIVALRTEYQ